MTDIGKVTVQGVGEVNIPDSWFVAEGGEKRIYAHGDAAYCIYGTATGTGWHIDPSKMISPAKIKELTVLTNPNIIKPGNLILDKKSNKPIGHTARFIQDAQPLTIMFPKIFKQKHSLTPDKVLILVKLFQRMVAEVHASGILIVDLNELNWLVNRAFSEIYGIDVNSYQTPSFPAPVIMPNIRDPHCKAFSEGTDWYSWGIIAFSMIIGMHAYRGGHPDFASLPPDQRLLARMKANKSALNPQSTLPGAALPVDIIPPGLRAWMFRTFENGERVPPPLDYEGMVQQIVTQVVKQIKGSNLFMIQELQKFTHEVIGVCVSGATRVVVTENGAYFGTRRVLCSPDAKVAFTPKMNRPVSLHKDNGHAVITDLENGREIYKCSADGVMTYDGRCYIRAGLNVLEVQFIEVGQMTRATVKVISTVLDLPEATKMFDGVILQNASGRYYASIFPEAGICKQFKIMEIDGYRLIEAKYENHVLVIVAEKGGKYDRFVMRFNDDYSKYDVRKIEDIDYQGLNFTVTDAGICVMMNEQEKIEAFSNKMNAGSVKVIEDPALDGDIRLFHDGAQVLFSKDKILSSMTMRKK